MKRFILFMTMLATLGFAVPPPADAAPRRGKHRGPAVQVVRHGHRPAMRRGLAVRRPPVFHRPGFIVGRYCHPRPVRPLLFGIRLALR